MLAVGETVDLDACAVYSDSSEDCTITATWESRQPGVATVDNGRVTGVAQGTAYIRATYQTVSATAEITVEAASAVALSIFGPREFVDSRELEVAEEVQLRAEVELWDGSTREPENAEWRSGNTTVATVSSNGLLIGRQAGSFDLRVTAEGLTARITGIRVVAPPGSETTEPDPEPDADRRVHDDTLFATVGSHGYATPCVLQTLELLDPRLVVLGQVGSKLAGLP